MKQEMRWYHSLVFRNNLAAFVATHIPLLGLILLTVVWPGMLSPLAILLTALVCTLVATAGVIFAQWRLFKPLRDAADGLKGFMVRGAALPTGPESPDEVGRLMTVLVRSLAHLERGRAPLLHASAISLSDATQEVLGDDPAGWWLALVEVDDVRVIDTSIPVLAKVQRQLNELAVQCAGDGELAVPWGRGRVLLVLRGATPVVRERVEALCAGVSAIEALHPKGSASAVVEPGGESERTRAAALQRLEQRMFDLRLQGRTATVA